MTTVERSATNVQLDIGKRIQVARRESGLSQAQLAEQVGVSRVAISEMESGRRKVSSVELAALTGILGQPASHFLGQEPEVEESYGAPAITFLARTARQLGPEDQDQLLRFADYLKKEARKRDAGGG